MPVRSRCSGTSLVVVRWRWYGARVAALQPECWGGGAGSVVVWRRRFGDSAMALVRCRGSGTVSAAVPWHCFGAGAVTPVWSSCTGVSSVPGQWRWFGAGSVAPVAVPLRACCTARDRYAAREPQGAAREAWPPSDGRDQSHWGRGLVWLCEPCGGYGSDVTRGCGAIAIMAGRGASRVPER